ncbi:MCE family protein [Nocardia sp.]|uniref:MCE family protein n=1 Tax=Nocardia sp. TaxID=1821 RepID=UPI002627F673|nr:MCE family protein [Nocardia sp.]
MRLLTVLAAVGSVLLATAFFVERDGTNHVSAYFRSASGLYVGDRVMILGVPVGTVDKIEPGAKGVRVEFTYDAKYSVPADAQAVIIAPTLVTGRYVQLAPAFTGGPTLADHATIPIERTASPVEFDEIKQQLVQLSRDVGPNDADQRGALNSFLDTTAATMTGNGQSLHDSLTALSNAARTLDAGGSDLFASVDNLQAVTTAIAAVDNQISGFSDQLASLSGVLNSNRTELDALLSSIQTTFTQVTQFITQNRAALGTDVVKATTLTRLLVDRIDTVAQILHAAPSALSDLYNIYDPESNSLTGAVAIPDGLDPRSLICALLTTVNAPAGECTKATTAFVGQLASAVAPQLPSAPSAPVGPIPSLADILNPRGGH